MKAFDIVGYTYQAANYCNDCIVYQMPKDSISPAAFDMNVEDVLNQLAAYLGVDRDDEWSFDSGDFPKVIFQSMVEDWETCAQCDNEL